MKKRFTQNFSFDSKQIFRLGAILILMFCGVSASRAASNVAMQTERVSGVVVDEKTGEAIIGASVQIYGTKKGTVTDYDGKFSLEVADPSKSKLQISYVGYKPQQVNIKGQTDIKVLLADNSEELKEVVVLGYGTATRGANSSSVSTVKAKDLNLTSVASVDNALQGGVAGLNISMNSAAPGSSASITLRGALSVEGSNAPLYVIDGVPIMDDSGASGGAGGTKSGRSPMATINPADIESISVLKDASATAIYGSAAANGVILVTTKSGKSGESKVSYDGKCSFQTISRFFEVMDGSDYMNYANLGAREAWLFDKKLYPYSNKPVYLSSTQFVPLFKPEFMAAQSQSYDHMKDITRIGQIFENNISISGGNDKSTYFISFANYNQKSLLKSTDFERISGRIKLEATISKWVKFSTNTMVSYVDAYNPNVGEGGMETSTALSFTPLLPLYGEDGSISKDPKNGQAINPGVFQRIFDRTYTKRFMFSPKLELKLTSDLKWIFQGGIDYSASTQKKLVPEGCTMPLDGFYNSASIYNYSSYNSNIESFFDFSKTIASKHALVAVIGVGGYRTGGESMGATTNNHFDENIGVNSLQLTTDIAKTFHSSNKYETTKLSTFSRFTYTYNNIIGLSATGRIDGSTNFAPNHKFGFFPGVSGNLNINEFDFLKGSDVVSNLKLRVGYGTTGNETATLASSPEKSYSYLNKFVNYWGNDYYFGSLKQLGYSQSTAANKDLRWETDIMKNIGIDFAFFKGRLYGTLEGYIRTANDLLMRQYLPANSLVSMQLRNVGSTQAEGIELTLGYKIIETKDLTWDVNMTASHVYTYWRKRDPQVKLSPWIKEHDEMRAHYGYKSTGKLFQNMSEVVAYNEANKNSNYKADDSNTWFQQSNPGEPQYIDQNGDGKLNEDDVVKLGCWDPTANFGLRTSLKYKAVDFGVQTYGVINMITYDGWQTGMSTSETAASNMSIHAKEQWSSFNPDGKYHGVAYGVTDQSNPSGYSDYLLQHTSFLRIKSVNVGYTLVTKAGFKLFKSLRLFADANNLGLITNYIGFDPEMGAGSPFPIAMTMSFGGTLTF